MLSGLFKDARRGAKGGSFPIPYSYLNAVFRLDRDDLYKPEPAAGALLADLFNQTHSMSLMRNKKSAVFYPNLSTAYGHRHSHDLIANAAATGAIIYSGYFDLTGRPGLSLAILPPRPFARRDDGYSTAVTFAFRGYHDGKQDLYLHDLRCPYFDYRFSRQTNLGAEPQLGTNQPHIARDFRYAQTVATALFAGQEPDIFTAWDKASGLPSYTPEPWQDPPKTPIFLTKHP